MRRALDFVKALGFFVLLALAAAWFAQRAEISVSGRALIIDGDSLVVDGQEIRLEGIDAPELSQTCLMSGDGSQHECGRRAKAHLRLITEQGVVCTGWEFDRYQRLLGSCTAGDLSINQTMVEDGWAVSYGDYQMQENAAREAQRGIWASEFENPAHWRNTRKSDGWLDWFSSSRFW